MGDTGERNDMDTQLERFRTCAEAYGADRRRWPAKDQAAFDALAGTPAGAAILAAAERTDAFLDALPAHAADEALAARIVAAATGDPPRRARRRAAWSAVGFALSAVLGFAIGFAQAPEEPSTELVTQLLVGPSAPPGLGL